MIKDWTLKRVGRRGTREWGWNESWEENQEQLGGPGELFQEMVVQSQTAGRGQARWELKLEVSRPYLIAILPKGGFLFFLFSTSIFFSFFELVSCYNIILCTSEILHKIKTSVNLMLLFYILRTHTHTHTHKLILTENIFRRLHKKLVTLLLLEQPISGTLLRNRDWRKIFYFCTS